MKRTAKWHKHITIKQMKHLEEFGSLSLRGFKQLRSEQRALALRCAVEEVCWECRVIERRLAEAGVLTLEN